ncbi:hypothetical protein JNUCC32_31045 (plasmid) [Paenibacillus sp. JNUCC32]|uniref:hypothetical protein n=1 Tax=Paenibacillus sp. JNUCC32 TaxID=2777984 RepID=UPI001787C235|nr:hypothetical protein [Paenibacillus sp. JNUCC-32]QOT13725.1 hypothetical protein JNUCC32_31045 [Paenibacillus sp. JNUCC-32]
MKQRFRLPLDLQLFAEEGGGEGGQEGAEQKPAKVELTAEQQAAVDAMIKERLARQQKKFDDEKAAAKAEAERMEREKNEEYKRLYQDAQAELDRARTEAKTAALNATKTQLLIEAGYSAEQLARVSKYVIGEDEDAIKASIAEVIADMPPKANGVDPNPGNGRKPDPKPGDLTNVGKTQYERLKAAGKLRR